MVGSHPRINHGRMLRRKGNGVKKMSQVAKSLASSDEFFSKIHVANAYAYRGFVNTRIINGQYVGVITGNLRRSVSVDSQPTKSRVYHNLAIAPYTPNVARRTKEKYGQTFHQIGLAQFRPIMQQAQSKELSRMIRAYNSGRPYNFQNPYFT